MEEVQSWWEVPSIAHFCYVFRSAFNLFFFEIAELESAILNIQDPDMSISLEQLITKLLQGFYEDDSVTETSWEEKLHELFDDNLDDDENPFDKNSYFNELTPRSKVEILHKLCDMRIDVKGVLEEIKDIPSEDMQAKCMGKDKENNVYWYFCDERLYKENPSIGNKSKQPVKNVKNTPNKRQIGNLRERKTKVNVDIDKPWSIACFNVSDWEKMMKTFSKSKSANEKELSIAIKNHLPILEERVAEKDRLLRKRYLELAPKRTSSRISKVQAARKIEEMKAAEEARLAEIEAEKERVKKETLMLKMQKESRQKRIEERRKAMEERAERAKLRELARTEDSDESDEDNDESAEDNDDSAEDNDERAEDSDENDSARKGQVRMSSTTQKAKQNARSRYQESEDEESNSDKSSDEDHVSKKNQKRMPSRTQTTKQSKRVRYQESESDNGKDSDEAVSSRKKQKKMSRTQTTKQSKKIRYQESESEEENDDSTKRISSNNYQSTSRGNTISKSNTEAAQSTGKSYLRTYLNLKQNCKSNEPRSSSRIQSSTKNVKYKSESVSEEESDSNHAADAEKRNGRSEDITQNAKDESDNEETDDKSPVTTSSSKKIKIKIKNSSNVKAEASVSKQDLLTLPNNRLQNINTLNLSPKVTVYKAVLQNTSEVSKWNASVDSKGQKLHILNSSYGNLASKKLKLEPVTFKTVSPNMKSSLSKENQIYKPVQTAFITYGKIIPSSSIVKLEYMKPPNPQVSSKKKTYHQFNNNDCHGSF